MNKYLIIIEKTETGFSAYSPDLPGCIATGKTIKEAEKQMMEAMEFHIEGLIDENLEIPKPITRTAGYIKLTKKRRIKCNLVTA
ncbi:type II toxin-antitoxin system HicB family antitoxin [Bacteroidota bacterium]